MSLINRPHARPALFGRLALIAAIGLAACTSAAGTPTGITSQTISCPAASTLTYANFGQQFIADNCGSCHDTRQSPLLTTQSEVQNASARIMNAAVYTEKMPQGATAATMSVDERALLGEWLACGAP